MKELLRQGARSDMRDAAGNTSLHLAAVHDPSGEPGLRHHTVIRKTCGEKRVKKRGYFFLKTSSPSFLSLSSFLGGA